MMNPNAAFSSANAVQGAISSRTSDSRNTTMLLGVRVDNVTKDAAMRLVADAVTNRIRRRPAKVFFTNVHTIHLARRDARFKSIVNEADIVLADGSGVGLAGRLMGCPILENLNGTDFIPAVLKYGEQCGWSVYLLGGRPHVTRRCRERLLKMFPRLTVAGAHHGHFARGEEDALIREINEAKPDLLLVAMGSPLQEQWIDRCASQVNVGLSFAVGGLFDFLSGERKRAPRWMRLAGVEWVYRFFQDPQTKWKRVFVEIPFFLAILLGMILLPKRLQEVRSERGRA